MDLACAEAAAVAACEYGGFVWYGVAGLQVAFERDDGVLGQRDAALFAAFACYGEPALFEMQVVEVEGDEFGKAQAAAVKQFENGAVALLEDGVGWAVAGGIEQGVQGFRWHGFGQLFAFFGCAWGGAGVGVDDALFDEVGAILPPAA